MSASVLNERENSVSFDVFVTNPAKGSIQSDRFEAAQWTVEDAVAEYCTEYELDESEVAVEWVKE